MTVTYAMTDSTVPKSRTKKQSLLKQIMTMPAGAILLVFATLQIVCIVARSPIPTTSAICRRRT